MTSSTTDDARFAALLDDVRREMPDAASASQIAAGFRRHWDAPPLRELELLLRRTTNLREARLLLFFPEPVDMLRYVALIARPPAGAPADHPQSKVRVPFLALLYMRHVRSWALVRQFILEGGLSVLSDCVADDNVYLRSQAIDTLMQITSTDLHDWFAEAPLEPAVHRRWLDLAAPSAKFMAHVAINLDKPTFPGGSHYCLQIVAFWLSLLRYFYCEQRVLRLGAEVMALLKRWAASTADGVSAEERELAQKLVDDFGRFPTVDGMHGQLIGAAGTGEAAPAAAADVIMEETVGAPERMAPVTEAATPAPPAAAADGEAALLLPAADAAAAEAAASAAATAEELKQRGNTAFAAGALGEAVALYTQALETAPAADRHKLLSNRAAAHLKAATREVEAAGAEAAAEAETTALELAAADARECVRLQPSFAKGHYRLGTALTRLRRPAEAVAVLEEGLRRAPMNDELRTALRAAREAQETARRAALREAKEGAPPPPLHHAAAAPPPRAPKVDYAAAAAAARGAEAIAAAGLPVAPGAADGSLPTSAQQFDREWSALRGAPPADRRAWLARLPADRYSDVFGESLSEATLASVVDCVDGCLAADGGGDDEVAAFAAQVLGGLASTKRFEMLLMFLGGKEKKAVQRIFDGLRARQRPPPAALAASWGIK